MNISTSECSSGCESGWTMYLDQSSNSQENNINIFHQKNHGFIRYDGKYLDDRDEADEDSSMVSDASSGPPHFNEDYGNYFEGNRSYFCDGSEQENKKKKKNKISIKDKKSGKKEQNLCLDDTASSSLKNEHMVLPPSGASMKHGTHYKGKSAIQKQIGFFQSSMSKKSGSGAAGGLQAGRRWE